MEEKNKLLQELLSENTIEEIGRFLKRLKVEMGGFKYSEALEVVF